MVCVTSRLPPRGESQALRGSSGGVSFLRTVGQGSGTPSSVGVPLPEEQSWVLGLHPHGRLTPLLLSPFPLPHLHNGLFVPGPQTPSAQPPVSAAGVGMAHLS